MANLGGTLVTLLPTKVMVFIDGTWLYYTLFERGRRCPINNKFGFGWQETHTIDFSKLPQIISDHISQELIRMQPRAERAVEVVRVLVFSSFRDEPGATSQRRRATAARPLTSCCGRWAGWRCITRAETRTGSMRSSRRPAQRRTCR